LTPSNIEPDSKNPLIADFFRNIGLADELGAGVRNLYKYTPRYSGKPPEIVDGDVFRIVVPLDDDYSFDMEVNNAQLKGKNCTLNCTLNEKAIIDYILKNPDATQASIALSIGKSIRSVKSDMAKLKNEGIIAFVGARKNGRWVITS